MENQKRSRILTREVEGGVCKDDRNLFADTLHFWIVSWAHVFSHLELKDHVSLAVTCHTLQRIGRQHPLAVVHVLAFRVKAAQLCASKSLVPITWQRMITRYRSGVATLSIDLKRCDNGVGDEDDFSLMGDCFNLFQGLTSLYIRVHGPRRGKRLDSLPCTLPCTLRRLSLGLEGRWSLPMLSFTHALVWPTLVAIQARRLLWDDLLYLPTTLTTLSVRFIEPWHPLSRGWHYILTSLTHHTRVELRGTRSACPWNAEQRHTLLRSGVPLPWRFLVIEIVPFATSARSTLSTSSSTSFPSSSLLSSSSSSSSPHYLSTPILPHLIDFSIDGVHPGYTAADWDEWEKMAPDVQRLSLCYVHTYAGGHRSTVDAWPRWCRHYHLSVSGDVDLALASSSRAPTHSTLSSTMLQSLSSLRLEWNGFVISSSSGVGWPLIVPLLSHSLTDLEIVPDTHRADHVMELITESLTHLKRLRFAYEATPHTPDVLTSLVRLTSLRDLRLVRCYSWTDGCVTALAQYLPATVLTLTTLSLGDVSSRGWHSFYQRLVARSPLPLSRWTVYPPPSSSIVTALSKMGCHVHTV